MIAVSNSSPLVALERIGRLGLLDGIFSDVLIPLAVAAETAVGEPPTCLAVRAISTPLPPAGPALGSGERESIALALETRPDWLILDDRPARRLARRLGLAVIGTVGVLVLAKDQGLISGLKPERDALLRSSFYLDSVLYQKILKRAGEYE